MSNHEEENTNDRVEEETTNRTMQVDALVVEIKRLIRVEMDAVHERLDRYKEEAQQRQPRNLPTLPRRGVIQPRRGRANNRRTEIDYYDDDDDDDDDDDHSSRGSRRRPQRAREGRDRTDDNLSGIKLKIPSFRGKNDPDAYLEWEKKIELVFDCQNYSEMKKVRVAATEFCDYAINWWDQLVTSRRRNGEYPIETWDEMKTIMRKRFVPSHYHRELHQKLRRLSQGSRNVEDYYQEMETLMIRADIDEDREATIARFLSGISRDLQDRMELQQYEDLEEMLHKAILMEQQLKRKGPIRQSYGAGSSSVRPNYSREEKMAPKPRFDSKPAAASQDAKGRTDSAKPRNRDVQCFRCHGKGHSANECYNKKECKKFLKSRAI